MAQAAYQVAGSIRGHRRITDQLQRASAAVPLLIAEGAHRRSVGQKRQRFVEARGECAETAAACGLACSLGLTTPELAEPVEILADRVAAMLTRLIARHEG
jgi:four helix bundle protein